MQHTSRQFENEMEALRQRVLDMGALAGTQLTRIQDALTQSTLVLTEEVMRTEQAINTEHTEIYALCTRIVALRQPTADDLRYVLATIHIISDIERIGDECKKVLTKLTDPAIAAMLASVPEITSMAAITCNMMQRAIAAFARQDAINALDTLRMDSRVDADYAAAIARVSKRLDHSKQVAGVFIECAFIARSIERCGDHVKNVAEEIVAIVRGEDLRHRSNITP